MSHIHKSFSDHNLISTWSHPSTTPLTHKKAQMSDSPALPANVESQRSTSTTFATSTMLALVLMLISKLIPVTLHPNSNSDLLVTPYTPCQPISGTLLTYCKKFPCGYIPTSLYQPHTPFQRTHAPYPNRSLSLRTLRQNPIPSDLLLVIYSTVKSLFQPASSATVLSN